jgi:hypothetical protein
MSDTARPEVVTLLADIDFLTRIGERGCIPTDKPISEFIRESRHDDGRAITEAEAELICSAGPEDLRAVIRLLDAEQDG